MKITAQQVITSPTQVTPKWLTAVLQQAGVLDIGQVTAVSLHQNEAFNSVSFHLHLNYSTDAPSVAPKSLFLKLNNEHEGQTEIALYQQVQHDHQMPHSAFRIPHSALPLVKCYDLAYDPDNGRSHLLLADHSATHAPPVTRQQLLSGHGIPSQNHLHAIIDALSRFHAYWWQPLPSSPPSIHSSELFLVRWWYRDETFHQQHVERRRGEYTRFIEAVGGTIPAEWRQLYDHLLAGMPRLWQKYLQPRVTTLHNLTLSHGDCYLTQFLCPITESSSLPTYLIDFGDASLNFPTYDLVYLMPAFWRPEQRQQHETAVLQRYHQSLLAHGVTNYSYNDLLDDYRLMLSYMLFDAIWNQTSGSTESYWRPKLECLTRACLDWDCQNL